MSENIVNVVSTRHSGGYRLHVAFEDGVEGELDVLELLGQFTGVFATLSDIGEFAKAFVDDNVGTVCWPNGADLDPCVLYDKISSNAAA